MSKIDLRAIVESCVYMDPFAHVYYAAHKWEAAHRVWSEQDEAVEEVLEEALDVAVIEGAIWGHSDRRGGCRAPAGSRHAARMAPRH